jgi:hypothetical protein
MPNHTLIENQARAIPPKINKINKAKCVPIKHKNLINSDQNEGLGGSPKLKLIISNQDKRSLALSQTNSRL